MSDEITKGIAAVDAFLDRADVFGFEYEDEPTSERAYFQNRELIDRLMGEPDCGASIWRSTTPERDVWFVLAADNGLGLREKGDWLDGKPYVPDPLTEAKLLERHLAMMLDGVKRGGPHNAYYGEAGARLGRGGLLEPMGGQDA